jgi:hypothetical protein
MGGAWQCTATLRARESKPCDSLEVGVTAKATADGDTPCKVEGCTKGACIVGMALQQSWPR